MRSPKTASGGSWASCSGPGRCCRTRRDSERLIAAGVRCGTCWRRGAQGSLDSAIVTASIVINGFQEFFEQHPDIRMVCCNGTKAWELYRRHVLPTLLQPFAALELRRLPSTSPANASIRLDSKLELGAARWRRSRPNNTVMPNVPLEVEHFGSAADFLRDVGPWLLASEADNSVLLSIVHLLAGGDHPFQQPFYLAAVKQAGRIVGCAVRPPPDQLDLTALPPGAVELLIGGVAALYPTLHMVAGPPDTAVEFARAWTRERGGHWRIRYKWTLLAVRAVARRRRRRGVSDSPRKRIFQPCVSGRVLTRARRTRTSMSRHSTSGACAGSRCICGTTPARNVWSPRQTRRRTA